MSGVSWFEAAAFAVFAGKDLPTVHHWLRAAGHGTLRRHPAPEQLRGPGHRARGEPPRAIAFGAYDMAGNVKEWCANASGTKRYILGGGWNEPSYMFSDPDAQSPWDRLPSYGFRCAQVCHAASAGAEGADRPGDEHPGLGTPRSRRRTRSSRSTAASTRTTGRSSTATVESVEEAEHWRREKVSFDAAYGRERVPAYLFLPRNARPPYQTVVFWPAGEATRLRSSADIRLKYVEFLLRSGRAVLHPIYKGTYERRCGTQGRAAPRRETS